MIWKLQRPVMTNGNYNEIMAYPEDRSRNVYMVLTPEEVMHLFGDEYKVYAKAKVKKGNLVIDYLVPEQDW